MIVCRIPDLLIRSKVDVAVRHYGVEAFYAPDAGAAIAAAGRPGVRLVLVDLDAPGVDGAELVRELRAATSARIVGFCSHVMADLIRAARDAGANTVMANSTFAASVPGLVAEAAAKE